MSAMCPPPLMIERDGEHVVLWPVENERSPTGRLCVGYVAALDLADAPARPCLLLGGIEINHQEDWYSVSVVDARRLAMALLAASEWAELASVRHRTTADLSPGSPEGTE